MVFKVEAGDLGMRAPHEASHLHPSFRKLGEHLGEFLAVDELLVGVATPVGELTESPARRSWSRACRRAKYGLPWIRSST